MHLTPPAAPAALTAAWTPYLPPAGSVTLGNGSWAGSAYQQVGKHVWFRIVLTVGSTTSIDDRIFLGLPVSVKSIAADSAIGQGVIYDDSAGARFSCLAIAADGSNEVSLMSTSADEFLAQDNQISLTTPDTIVVTGDYETA